MDRLIIEGGRRLKGEVLISGAKNAALPAIAAALLAPGKSVLKNVPDLMDVKTMGRLVEKLGARFGHDGHKAVIDTSGIKSGEVPYELVKTMRASVLVLGPLLARFGKAKVSLPGGCAIGARPINLHLTALEKMGAKIELEGGYVSAKADRLKGANIYFDIVTVTGTENLMMAACLARGKTVLENAAREPEVADLAKLLISMGARIKGAGESTIEIEGVDELKPFEHTVIPDRIEAGTFMAAAAITGGDITLKGAMAGHMEALIHKMAETGLDVHEQAGGIGVSGPKRPLSRDITTAPYPGFPTDMQAQFMAVMSIADGTSLITETVFPERFMHAAELKRMGADITVKAGTATVKGVKGLKAAEVMATDLRASASLVVAALSAKGRTTIHRVYHLDRGYENIEVKLRGLGAAIERVK